MRGFELGTGQGSGFGDQGGRQGDGSWPAPLVASSMCVISCMMKTAPVSKVGAYEQICSVHGSRAGSKGQGGCGVQESWPAPLGTIHVVCIRMSMAPVWKDRAEGCSWAGFRVPGGRRVDESWLAWLLTSELHVHGQLLDEHSTCIRGCLNCVGA